MPGMPGTQQNVSAKAKRGEWKNRKRKARGGGYEYHISSLPEETRMHLAAQTINDQKQTDIHAIAGAHEGRKLRIQAKVDQAVRQRKRMESMRKAICMDAGAQVRMDAKLAILNALDEYRAKAGIGISRARESFVHVYRARMAGLEEWVYEAIEDFSASSLANWQRDKDREGITALAGRYGNRKGSSKIDTQPELKNLIVATLTEFPHTSVKNIVRTINARKNDDLADVDMPSKRAVERWVQRWKQDNREVFTAVTNPDAWKSTHMVAYGSRSEGVNRLNQLWEMDATPADLMLLDGRYSLSGLISVYSRRPKLLVTKTPKAEAHCSLLRQAIIEWGVPEKIKHDGGQDYVAKRMMRVFESLAIESHKCAPFSPWEKPHIERFFRSFSHSLLELLPGYIGHSVADRKQIEDRQAFSDRLFKKDGAVEIRMTAADFQAFCDEWINSVYMQDPHEGLGRKTPLQVVAESRDQIRKIDDERVLDLLLSDAPGDGFRTATKKGIKIDKLTYIAPELADYAGERLRVLYDPNDMGRVYCYSADSEFVCIAECPEVTGISRQEVAQEARQRQKKRVTEARRQLKAEARKQNLSEVAREIVDKRRADSNLVAFPKPESEHESAGIEAAREAVAAAEEMDTPAAPEQLTPSQQQAMSRIKARIENDDKISHDITDDPRRAYAFWLRLDERVERGEELSEQDQMFWTGYPMSPGFRSMRRMFEEFPHLKSLGEETK